jgi:hypothetical protein
MPRLLPGPVSFCSACGSWQCQIAKPGTPVTIEAYRPTVSAARRQADSLIVKDMTFSRNLKFLKFSNLEALHIGLIFIQSPVSQLAIAVCTCNRKKIHQFNRKRPGGSAWLTGTGC